VQKQTGRHPRAVRRRWRGLAIAAAATAVLAGGLATANAATSDEDSQATALSTAAVETVVDAAETFLGTLSDDQQAEVLLELSAENVAAWSNLSCAGDCRPGIALGSLTDAQSTAARAVLSAALGTGDGAGFDQATQILRADDVLAGAGTSTETGSGTSSPADPSGRPSAQPSGSADPSTTTKADETAAPDPSESASAAPADGRHGSGLYYLAFLGIPSTEDTWQLHFGGNNLAVNLTYADGGVISASPYFAGAEPTSFTSGDTTYQPLDAMRAALQALTAGLDEVRADQAHGTDAFDDVVRGPGVDGGFPDDRAGIAGSELSDDQRDLLLAAIRQWVSVADDATATALLAEYEADLDDTYLVYSGSPDLSAPGDYVRIDGPGVWIEFVCRAGAADPEQLSYQSIYRDRVRDYGGGFTF
jgi:hypothetical protein